MSRSRKVPKGSDGASVPDRVSGLPPHLDAMTRADFYPHGPRRVEMRQTHISWVFLAGDSVFKVKKPVRFAFIDASTRERRRQLCLDEVRLNRRLAPDIYVGVREIIERDGKYSFGPLLQGDSGTSDHALEYAVEMKRLDTERMLDRLVARNEATPADIHAIARYLAAFHRDAASERASMYGDAAAVSRMVCGNLKECERFERKTLSPAQLAGLAQYASDFAGSHWLLLNRRPRGGRVREGHGDLRCEHICLTDRIEIFDCVEFNEALRYCDVACDVAFLAMDLEHIGANALARELTESYARLSSDEEFLQLARFYCCYRAAVRGKVESIRSVEPEVPAEERERAKAIARSYFAQACRYAGVYDGRPCIIVVCGMSGSGKSTVARALAEDFGFEVIGSDATRKVIAGATPTTRMKAEYGAGIYTEEFTRKTYASMIDAAGRSLDASMGVIFDATFREAAERAMAVDLARRKKAAIVFVLCHTDESEIVRRLRERAGRSGSISDADVAIYLRQRQDFVPLTEIKPEQLIDFDTLRSPHTATRVVGDALARLCD